jgi:flavin-binding protein dodecin
LTTRAVERAAKTLRDLRVAEVVKQDLVIEDGKVEAYRTKLKVSFKFESKA